MALSDNRNEAAQAPATEAGPATPPARLPWFVAKCRTASGSKYDLPVLDLSAGGCLVELGFRAFKLGERVLVGLPGLSAIPGEVVWIEEKDAGIAFESVLHEAVFENLIAARQR
jgi:hypothetical protein